MLVQLPYGKKTLPLDVPDKNFIELLLPQEIIPPEHPGSMIKDALYNPLGTDRLSEMANRGDRVAIVVDDHTRPCPTQQLLPPILDELKEANVYDSDVVIIIANGTHKPPSFDIIKKIVGDKITRNYRVISNDVDHGEYINVGKTRSGNNVEILRDYVEADIKIVLGDIEYHYFAGYGGTRKSILPGIASRTCIQRNHQLLFEKHAQTGVLKENPVHQDMNEAMHLVGCDFALNVVLNSNHRIVGAWAGKPESVLDAGIKMVDSMYKRMVSEKPDIVVAAANGHPHDIDMYQVVKALHNATSVLKENGVLILVAECSEGHGSQLYIDWLKKHKTSEEVEKSLRKNFLIGAHKAYYHLKAVENHTVILVSSMSKSEVENIFRFKHASTPDEALQKAFSLAGKNARILVVPQGTTTLLVEKQEN